MFRRTGLLVAALVVAAGLAPVAAGSAVAMNSQASARAPYCGITWGSQVKIGHTTTMPELTNIRAGRHDCFDRLVFDVRGGNVTGYWVQYVAAVTEPGRGQVVPLRGGAKLSVMVQAPGYDDLGRPTYHVANGAELVNVAGFRTFRQVAWAGTFEGESTVGLGVRARLPFRVFTLPSRIVIDVAHRW